MTRGRSLLSGLTPLLCVAAWAQSPAPAPAPAPAAAPAATARSAQAPTGFELAVSPSRLELAARSGQRLGQALALHNLSANAAALAFRTLDWTLSESGELSYHDALLPGSCRPWVTLERRTRSVPARSRVPFRLQIDPPADAPRGECRFMVAIEGLEPAHQAQLQGQGASLQLPVGGRIAVAVYVAVNGARPQLELLHLGSDSIRTQRRAVVTVRNRGDAHGRLDGALEATDADGREWELLPDNGPILPGHTRTLALNARPVGSLPAGAPAQPRFPLRVQGQLNWDDGAFDMKATLP